jgi:hypothetical protein
VGLRELAGAGGSFRRLPAGYLRTSACLAPRGPTGLKDSIHGQRSAAQPPAAALIPVSGGTKGAKIFNPFGACEEAQALYPSHSNWARRSPFLGSKMEGRARVALGGAGGSYCADNS